MSPEIGTNRDSMAHAELRVLSKIPKLAGTGSRINRKLLPVNGTPIVFGIRQDRLNVAPYLRCL